MVDYVAERIGGRRGNPALASVPVPVPGGVLNVEDDVPHKIKAALHQAAEIACGNVPELPGPVVIGLDTSGFDAVADHGGPRQGLDLEDAVRRRGGTVRRGDPAPQPGQRRHPVRHAGVRRQGRPVRLDSEPGGRLAKYGGGGTDCSIPLRVARTTYGARRFAGAVLVSDNESWVYKGRPHGYGQHGSTGVITEWQQFVQNQLALGGEAIPQPKLVCIDLQPRHHDSGPGPVGHPERRRLQ